MLLDSIQRNLTSQESAHITDNCIKKISHNPLKVSLTLYLKASTSPRLQIRLSNISGLHFIMLFYLVFSHIYILRDANVHTTGIGFRKFRYRVGGAYRPMYFRWSFRFNFKMQVQHYTILERNVGIGGQSSSIG